MIFRKRSVPTPPIKSLKPLQLYLPAFERYDLDIDIEEESTDEFESSLRRLILSPPKDMTRDRDSGTEMPRWRFSDAADDDGLLTGSGAEIKRDMCSGLGVGVGTLSSWNKQNTDE